MARIGFLDRFLTVPAYGYLAAGGDPATLIAALGRRGRPSRP